MIALPLSQILYRRSPISFRKVPVDLLDPSDVSTLETSQLRSQTRLLLGTLTRRRDWLLGMENTERGINLLDRFECVATGEGIDL